MKKQLLFGVAVLLICVGLSGCNNYQNAREVEVTILSTEYIDSFISDFELIYLPEEGYKYFVVELKVKNVGTQQTHVNVNYATISDTQGMTWTYTEDTHAMIRHFSYADVQPNNHYEGKIIFEISNNSTPNNFYYNDLLYNDVTIPISEL